MAYSFEKIILSAYRGLFQWRFFYRHPGPVVAHHKRLLCALEHLELTPAQSLLANYLGVHLIMSARDQLLHPNKNTDTRALRQKLAETAFDIHGEIQANLPDSLSARSRALLDLTGCWIIQRSSTYHGATRLQEESYQMIRNARLAEWRERASERLCDLEGETRTIALAMLTAGDGDGAKIHQYLRVQAGIWWQEGRSDQAIYTLRDQINKTFIGSPCYWLFDATMSSLLDDLPDVLPGDTFDHLRHCHAERGRRRTRLLNRYLAQYPERSNGHLLNYSIEHRGYRVHAVAASRDITLIDDIINAGLPDSSVSRLLYQFDDYRSSGAAHAKFRALLTRHGIRLTHPVTIAERKDILKQEAFFASLPSRKAA